MYLSELLSFETITIQCHDNPDADSIGSGFALLKYFQSKGKNVRLIYGGKFEIKKSNLCLLVNECKIPIEYVGEKLKKIPGLLITVDGQYGAGNVTKIKADEYATIDHHCVEVSLPKLHEVADNMGSCCTLVWKLLRQEKFPIDEDLILGTALYYGLYTDTNMFAEIYNPLDMDMRDSLEYVRALFVRFKNSNISLKDLETAGIAMIRNIYNSEHRYAIMQAEQCDPNILGLISDFLLQVDSVDTCVVYNDLTDGYKISVRSCVKEVMANEMAQFICDGIGSGGGHIDKAGGFISKKLYNEKYHGVHSEAFFSQRMSEYFDSTRIIYTETDRIDTSEMKSYRKNPIHMGYAVPKEFIPIGTNITIRTDQGDVEMEVTDDLIIMINQHGTIYPNHYDKFISSYTAKKEAFDYSKYCDMEYSPTIRRSDDNSVTDLMKYAKHCTPIIIKNGRILAKELDYRVKIFTEWDDDRYMLGKPGDYLVVRKDDADDIYVVRRDRFFETYTEIEDYDKI